MVWVLSDVVEGLISSELPERSMSSASEQLWTTPCSILDKRAFLFAKRLPSLLWLACLVLPGERKVAHQFVPLFVGGNFWL
jgi:hypothetical protein